MHGDTFPRVPGLGLAPTPETRHINRGEQDALLRDAIAREDATYRATRQDPCPPERYDTVSRPVRAGAA